MDDMSCSRIRFSYLILAVIVLFSLTSPVIASDIAGKLRGTVSDPSGAVVPEATVIARQVATNAQMKATSGPDGAYVFESLLPGTYVISCEHAGFKKYVASDIRVISQATTTLNIALPLGRVEETVQVADAATQVDASNATIQNTLGDQQLMNLPVNGRDFRYTAELTQPGTIEGPPANTGPTTRVNGTRGNTGNNYKIDGTESIDYYNGAATAFPEAENVQEFTVQSNAYGAEYGTGVGSQVTAVIKSGTNNPHGMLWGYFTNSGWNANTWEGNRTGTPRPAGSQRWYGGNFGGPVYIPHVYDGRNKTFFFVSYEHTHRDFQALQQTRVLTDAERLGDFSNDDFGVPVINGVPTPQLDPNNFSPMAKALLANSSLLPTTNDPSGLFNWLGSGGQTTQPFIAKIDHVFNDKHRIFGSLFWYRDDNLWDPLLGIQFGGPTLPNEGTSNFNTHLQAWSFNDTYTISPTKLNTFILGIRPLAILVGRAKVNQELNWANVGVPNIQVENGGFPTQVGIIVNGWTPGVGFMIWGNYDNPLHESDLYIADDFTWIKGRHTLQMGFALRNHGNKNYQNWDAAGEFDFYAGQPGSTGNPFADLLLGTGAAFYQGSLLDNNLKYPSREAYFQDEMKISRKLTATLGLRWSPHFGAREEHNQLGAFRPGQQSVMFPHAPTGLVVPGDPGVPPATYPNRYWDFAPRIGLAYDIFGNGKMAIRAGYGIYYDYENLLGFDQFATSVPYGFLYYPPPPSSVVDPYNGQTFFPYHIPSPGTPEAKSFVFPNTPLTIGSFAPNFNAGRVHQWNVSYEWEPAKNYLLTVAYVATRGTHLSSSLDQNTPLFIPGNSTDDNQQERRPYPLFQNIFEQFAGSSSFYNSLQLTLNKRFSRAFSILGAYTYSKATDNGDTIGRNFSAGSYRNPRDIKADYGVSDYDYRHVLSLTYNWELPFFPGAHIWMKKAFGGWVWSGTLRASTGAPLTISSPADFDHFSANGAWANYVGGSVYGDHSNRNAQANSWLSSTAFCPANAYGTACTVDPNAGLTYLAVGNSWRGIARGPGRLFNDMTLAKRVPISEGRTLELRLAAFNLFNHTVLQNPDANIADVGAGFGQIFTAYPPRRLQLSVHFMF